MLDGPYALALAAGMAATVNPCGFALLPAYLSTFLVIDQHRPMTNPVARALAVSVTLTAGFAIVFGAFGLIVTPFALSIERHLPWVTIVIGIGLVGLGALLLSGRELLVRIPKLHAGGDGGSLVSMFLFGVSYAVASLSCTIGPFLAVTTSTFRSSSWLAGSGIYLTYALGMGVIIGILTVAVSFAKTAIIARFRRIMPIANRIAGGLLVIAGIYVAYYGWYEIRVLADGAVDDPIMERATSIQTWLEDHVVPDSPVRATVILLAILAVAALAAAHQTRRRRRTTRSS